ncbi:MAG: bifunctional adenosylcobinamide kinase/adenosylcobinamide-phosphate guanylyltransferase [Pseudobutyrivibrio sp.]|nr:bifunctional adenosylcobinamide kinase/adenosylcobinamide-phosphate guanylyltransferase [Pseudobutyrivibrio sp.]
MITLIYGGSSSGKSAFAEQYTYDLPEKNKYYLATMASLDQESRERISRHRAQRCDRNFITLEYATGVDRALPKVEEDSCILLECMSNLVANEMFSEGEIKPADTCVHEIIKQVQNLSNGVAHLIIVSNNIFEDGAIYDEATKEYMRALGEINEKVAAISDAVYEVVVGIPIKVKETEHENS